MLVETNNLSDVAEYAAIRKLTTSRIYQLIAVAENEKNGSLAGRVIRICDTPYVHLIPQEIKLRKQLKQQ